jgi:glycosyltransferase involved in cell wall biosynthesis
MPVKKIVILFLGDIRYDSRCLKIVKTLDRQGHKLTVIIALDERQKGQRYQLLDSSAKVIPIYLKRRNKKQPFLQYYFKVLRKIRSIPADIYFSAELYSLPLAYLASKKFRSAIFYDSRELYSHIAALKNKRFKQWIWNTIEKFIIKRVKKVFTVNESIAEIIANENKIAKPIVLYNTPFLNINKNISSLYSLFDISRDKKLLLYQGGLQSGRGIPILLEIIESLDEFSLIFLGQGNFEEIITNHKLYKNHIRKTTELYIFGISWDMPD